MLEGRHRRREAGRLGRRFWPRAFSSSAKSVAGFVFARCSEARLLIPCLLGDPVSALDVKERSGVAAGTLFGRVVFFKLNPEDKEETAALQSPRGKAQLFQAFAPDAASGCWVDDGVLTAVFGVCEVRVVPAKYQVKGGVRARDGTCAFCVSSLRRLCSGLLPL